MSTYNLNTHVSTAYLLVGNSTVKCAFQLQADILNSFWYIIHYQITHVSVLQWSYCEIFIQSPDFQYITISNHYNCLNCLNSHQQDLFTKSLDWCTHSSWTVLYASYRLHSIPHSETVHSHSGQSQSAARTVTILGRTTSTSIIN